MKNGILYRCLETKHYLCTIIQNKMGINKLKVVLTEEAQAFLDAQPFKAQQKIYYNIFKVEEGVMKVSQPSCGGFNHRSTLPSTPCERMPI